MIKFYRGIAKRFAYGATNRINGNINALKVLSTVLLFLTLYGCETAPTLKQDTSTPPVIPTKENSPSTPYSYRGVIGGFNTAYDATNKTYISTNDSIYVNNYKFGMRGFVDTGLLAAIYDANNSSSDNYKYQAPIVMFGTGIAAKDSATFANLTAQTINNLYYNVAAGQSGVIYTINTETSARSNIATLSPDSMPLVLNTNIFKPDSANSEPPSTTTDDISRYNSTTTAGIINAIAPSGNDLYKRYTSTGFSNEKIFFYTLYNTYESDKISTLFRNAEENSANSLANLFYYDYFPTANISNNKLPKYAPSAANVKLGINALMNTDHSTTSPTTTNLSTEKVFVTAMGTAYDANGILSEITPDYKLKYINNVLYYDTKTYPSFAARVIDPFFLDKDTYNIMDPLNVSSVPITAVGVMEYCSTPSCSNTKYYVPSAEYNAGALSNVAISVPVSANSVIYSYNIDKKVITTNLAGNLLNYQDPKGANSITDTIITSYMPALSPNRQAAATLTAIIGAYQRSDVSAKDALNTILKYSMPMYSTNAVVGCDLLSCSAFSKIATGNSVSEVNETNVNRMLFDPAFIVLEASDFTQTIISDRVGSSSTYNVKNFGTSNSYNENNLSQIVLANPTDSYLLHNVYNQNYIVAIGEISATITSNDILVYDKYYSLDQDKLGYRIDGYVYKIVVMNDIWIGKKIMQYDAKGATTTPKAVDQIIKNIGTIKDSGNSAIYTAYYYCFKDETDESCTTPSRRIASHTYGLGMLNYISTKDIYASQVALAVNEGAIIPTQNLAISAMVMSDAFGNSIKSANLSTNIQAHNAYGETWMDVKNVNERVSNVANSPLFNSTSNAYYSQYNMQNYSVPVGSFGSFSVNLSNNNTNTGIDTGNPLLNSRFGDMASISHSLNGAMNSYGVILDQPASSTNFSNVAYSGSILGLNFISRMNFQAGMEMEKVTNFNPMKNSSIYYNPFLSLVSNQGDARGFSVAKNFGAYNKFSITTIVGKNSFNGNAIIFETPNDSNNVASTSSVMFGTRNNVLSFDAGFLSESRTLLGSYSAGALGLGQNNLTIFGKMRTSKNIFGKTNFIGAFSFGRTAGNSAGISLFTDVMPILSRSFVVGLSHDVAGGHFELTYAQPLAITNGGAVFSGINGSQFISFSSSVVEQDFGISFHTNSKKSSASFQALYIKNRGNLNVSDTFGIFGRFSRQL